MNFPLPCPRQSEDYATRGFIDGKRQPRRAPVQMWGSACTTNGAAVLVEVLAPTDEAPQAVLYKIITRTMKLLTASAGAS